MARVGRWGPVRLNQSARGEIKRTPTIIKALWLRLGFAPDLYYLHRIDPDTPLEEFITALDELRRAGKTK
ncbi:hypothetical protein BDV12DRAFT_176877 [Aspergillus spectabilis]